jgi:hypothetical protein
MLETKEVTFFEKMEMAHKLWQYVLPTVPFPPRETMIHWFAVYTYAEFETSVLRVPYRFERGLPENLEVYKFLSATMAMLRKKREQPAAKAPAKTAAPIIAAQEGRENQCLAN